MKKEKKKKRFQKLKLLHPKNLAAEVHIYGYNFSWKTHMLVVLCTLLGICSIGVLFKLEAAYFTITILAACIMLPVLILETYKRMYEQKRFADAVTYAEQMLYSFQKNGKVISALRETREIYEDGQMKQAIEDAIVHLEIGCAETEKGVLREALEMIEKQYACVKIHMVHELLISSEEFGGDVSNSILLVLNDMELWKRRGYKLQADKKTSHTDNMISIVVATILCAAALYVWYDGIYKDGYDYRNVNESLSLADKLTAYLSTWKEKAVYGVNVYSSQTSLTDSSLKINFDLSSSMAIQWNNGETSTVVTRSDIPEYNFPLVLNTYAVKYNGNGATGGSMSNSTMTYDKSANLTANKYQKTGYLFQGWSINVGDSVVYTDAQSVKNLTNVNNKTVNLYAVWKPIIYTVTYSGNGSTSGSMSNVTMTYDTVQNLTQNGFRRIGYTFKEWNTKADGSGTSYADGENVKNLTTQNGKTVTLYAQWKANHYMIVLNSNGGNGNMGSITAVYDTPMQLPINTLTRETEYGTSVFEGWNRDSDSFVSLYPNGGTVLNLTAENNGTVHLYAVWDDCPWITAEDLYYTLEEAQNGQITYDELMNRALAHDREDGSPIQQGYNPQKGTTFQLVDYQSSDFTQFEHDGSVTQTYEVIDSTGSRYTKMITVYVVDTAIREKKPIGTTRFINEKYYHKSYENGGLEADSIWKTDTEYALVLEQTFTNGRNHTPIISYSFTYEEIQQMKEFVENNGIGNSENTNALQRFYKQFM